MREMCNSCQFLQIFHNIVLSIFIDIYDLLYDKIKGRQLFFEIIAIKQAEEHKKLHIFQLFF